MLSLRKCQSKDDVTDLSNGYEAVAERYISHRVQHSSIGVEIVRKWANTLPARASVLDLGCGPGVPLSQTLIDRGCRVYGIDASSTMAGTFHERFPQSAVECGSVLTSTFFDRTFDGVLAWGLIFLLPPNEQETLIRKMAAALAPGGQLLFTAPWQICEWDDNLTRQRSYSLGRVEYHRLITESGLEPIGDDIDEGDNYYYFAQRDLPPLSSRA
jgi:2-polyprenyl-3-methyl-5-hydroxy-6-metoxy-1,4-benzoquinol methylase